MEEVEDSSPFSECRKLRLWIREESWSERLKIKRKGVKEREGLSITKVSSLHYGVVNTRPKNNENLI